MDVLVGIVGIFLDVCIDELFGLLIVLFNFDLVCLVESSVDKGVFYLWCE